MALTDVITPKCAVLLAVYNGMHFLKEQVETILEQLDVSVTLFVSIDLSTDGSEEWFFALSARDSRVIVLPYGEKFGGAARNFFRLIRDVNFSQFDFVAFADQDDQWYLNKLSRAIQMITTAQYDAYSSNVIAFWANGKRHLINKSQSQRPWDYIFESAGPGCTYVMRVNLISAIKEHLLNSWDSLLEVSLHDWYCYAFARAKGFKWFIDKKPSMLYRQHAHNQVGVNLGMKAYVNRFQKIKSGWWFNQALLIAELVGVNQSRFVQSWSRLRRIDLFRLSFHAFQCRRRLQEQVIFLCVCWWFGFTGSLRNIRIDHMP